MNQNEHLDVAKMAVGVLLIVLVLSGVVFLFYFLFGFLTKTASKYNYTVQTQTAEKLKDMSDMSAAGDYPPVMGVVNALSEVEDTGIIYVGITSNKSGNTVYFTSNGVTLTGVSGDVKYVSLPMTESCKYLMGYSAYECEIVYARESYGTDLKYDTINILIHD